MDIHRQGTDAETLDRLFGRTDLIPLWIAEPNLDVAPAIRSVLERRAAAGWYGYEKRPEAVIDAFWDWSGERHGWHSAGLHTLVSPSVGTSVGALIDRFTAPEQGVIIQPPVFTDFKTVVTDNGRTVVRNALVQTPDGYRMNLDGLGELASDPANQFLILCNPHNPVGRVWTGDELIAVANICADHGVFVLADEIHADLALAPHRFVPFGDAASGIDVRWASTHGPIKTFGLAGVCDTLLISGDQSVADQFQGMSSRLHLTRNNVFGLAAFEVAYRHGGEWLDDLLALVVHHTDLLEAGLPEGVDLVRPEGTYLAWLDLRHLNLDVGELAGWMASEVGVAVSPGHWFGREGAGFARLTTAVPTDVLTSAVEKLNAAVERHLC